MKFQIFLPSVDHGDVIAFARALIELDFCFCLHRYAEFTVTVTSPAAIAALKKVAHLHNAPVNEI